MNARLVGLFLGLAASCAHAVPERMSQNGREALDRLRANAGGEMRHHAAQAAAYGTIRATGSRPLMADSASAAPEDRARFFLSIYGPALGIGNPAAQLARHRVSRDLAGNMHVHLDQVHAGVPVFGARVTVHMNGAGVTGVNGTFVPNLDTVSVTPSRDVPALRTAALARIAKQHPGRRLEVAGGRFVIYPTGLLLGRLGESRLAYEAIVDGGADLREQVFVDAHTGTVLEQIGQVPHVRNREIYTPDQSGPPTYTEGAVGTPADPALIDDPGHAATTPSQYPNNPPLNNLYIFAGGTYALYKNLFGREGYDDCDLGGPCKSGTRAAWTPGRDDDGFVGQAQMSVYLVNQACPNAYWHPVLESTNYCPGFDADDVVSHEWSHAYTQFTHGLIYYYQSGALNESWSDIFGEAYDLVNGIEGPLGDLSLKEHYYYDEIDPDTGERGSRWVVGEDLSEEAATLLLRDMWDPDAFPAANPGKVTSPNYYCEAGDNGGVHYNSSVSNHAFAMLVDGKTYNGVTIPAIGLVKALHIYFQASSHYQHPKTLFPEHADALEQSCQDLIGTPINDLDGTTFGQTITAADCDAVKAAMLATEMRTPPLQCNYTRVLLPESLTPPVCGDSPGIPVFTETWEGGAIPAGWTLTSQAGPTGIAWTDLNWTVSSDLPAPHTGKAAFAVNPEIGEPGGGGPSCDPDLDVAGNFTLDSPEIPVGDLATRLAFTHFHQSESPIVRGGVGADGGNLKYSLNGGGFDLVPNSAFIFNPHSGQILPVTNPNTNPNAGEAAWVGVDQGQWQSQWGTSIVDVGALGAGDGDSIRFRWDMSQDSCNGDVGWYVDDVNVFTCPVPPVLSLGADYTDPDPDAQYTLTWTRPSGATGPDVVQESTLSCAPLFADGAETDLSRWVVTTEGSGAQNWQIVTNQKPMHSGATFWATYQENSVNTSAILTLKDPVNLPAGQSAKLRYEDWFLNEGDDNVYLDLSTDGTTWTQLFQGARSAQANDGALAFGTEQLFKREFDLSAYAGQAVRIRFRLVGGPENRPASTPLGWYVDNIAIVTDVWTELLTTSATSHTIAVGSNGERCYRVRTSFALGDQSIPSPYSNIVTAVVDAADFPPIANAGADITVDEGATAALNGTASSDADNDPMTFSWTQLAGPPVTLTGAATATPTFTAPDVPATTALVFELSVSNAGGSTTDEVIVTVRDIPADQIPQNNRLGGALPPPALLVLLLAWLARRRGARVQ